MVTAGRAKRQWKKAADAALSPECLQGERNRLSAEIARRVWAAHGGQAGADVRTEPALLSLEALIVPFLEDSAVRAAAALRFLEGLEAGVRRSDYEDVHALQAELRWASTYMRPSVEAHSLVRGFGKGAAPGHESSASLEELHAGLLAAVHTRLQSVDIAAA